MIILTLSLHGRSPDKPREHLNPWWSHANPLVVSRAPRLAAVPPAPDRARFCRPAGARAASGSSVHRALSSRLPPRILHHLNPGPHVRAPPSPPSGRSLEAWSPSPPPAPPAAVLAAAPLCALSVAGWGLGGVVGGGKRLSLFAQAILGSHEAATRLHLQRSACAGLCIRFRI